eukprot:tig00020877_g14698.t1
MVLEVRGCAAGSRACAAARVRDGVPAGAAGGFAHLVSSNGSRQLFQLGLQLQPIGEPAGAAAPAGRRLPSSQTCFNQLMLPRCGTYDELREALDTAIAADHAFGFA